MSKHFSVNFIAVILILLYSQMIIDKNQMSIKMRDMRLQALLILFRYPVISISELSAQLQISYNTANQIITEFVDLEFLVQDTEQKRGKLFAFRHYLDILERESD